VKLLRAATLTVADPEASARRYIESFGYRVVEQGRIDGDLAASWAAPRVAGRRFVVLEPASRAPVLLRFIDPVRCESCCSLGCKYVSTL
jgi:hypothetical protein